MIDLQSFILTYVNEFSYIGIFLLLIIIAIIPIPEELVLILVGYFAGYGFAEFDKILVIGVIGVLIGDNLLFLISKHSSYYINKVKTLMPKKFAKYEKHMKKHMGKTIFLLRFVVGLRFLSPVIAGSAKVNNFKFFLFDFFAVIIFVPVFLYLGYNFSAVISIIINKILLIKNFTIGMVLVASIFIIKPLYKKILLRIKNYF